MIIYKLKLPREKDFVCVVSKDNLIVGVYVEYNNMFYKVKRRFMTNEAGYMIELVDTKDKPSTYAIAEKWHSKSY